MDLDKLKTEIEAGKNAEEIMAVLKVKNIQSIKNAVLKLSIIEKKFYTVDGLFSDSNKADGPLKFGKFGLKLSKTRLENNGFKIDDMFKVVFNNGNITLEKVV